MYLGLPSVLLDSDTVRRSVYGRAGSFRTTLYGLEYRVLGGYMMSSTDYLSFIWDQLTKAIKAFNNNTELVPSGLTEDVINNSDSYYVKKLITKYNICEFTET